MELAKGVRDFPPEIQLIREDLFQRIRQAFERHGFAPFATPAIERMATLTHKFEGDEDVMSEIFKVTDQGDRNLGLRFDLTVPLCRFIAMNKDVKLPFKRYEIGRVYRDGPIKLGRTREFWQCDADIIGAPPGLADAECVKVLCTVLDQLPFEYVVKVNNRKILDAIMDKLGVASEHRHKAVMLVDKLAKAGEDEVKKQLAEFLDASVIDQFIGIITQQEGLQPIKDLVGETEGVQEMEQLLELTKGFPNVQFDPALARGLNYYTGFVEEAFLLNNEITGSVSGGGRYDDMIGSMIGSQEEVPAVGISFGIEPLTQALIKHNDSLARSSAQIFVAGIKSNEPASQLADQLRGRGFNVDLDVLGRSISKNLDYANKLGIPLVAIIGPKDVEAEQFVLKNMASGEETTVKLSAVPNLDLDAFL